MVGLKERIHSIIPQDSQSFISHYLVKGKSFWILFRTPRGGTVPYLFEGNFLYPSDQSHIVPELDSIHRVVLPPSHPIHCRAVADEII